MTRHFLRELDELERDIVTMGGLAENAVARAVHSFLESDDEGTRTVMDGDAEINAMELRIEEECLKILALYGPTAKDLRFVVGSFKITNDLERVGDLAVNIAERAHAAWKAGANPIDGEMHEMSDRVREMLRRALNAFLKQDKGEAEAVLAMDDRVDELLRQIYKRQHQVAAEEGPFDFDQSIRILAVAKYLERIADHATNIAEDVIYMASGEIVKHMY